MSEPERTVNVWNPKELQAFTVGDRSATEVFVAEQGQTTFFLQTFAYVVGTQSLQVYKNGHLLTPGDEWIELTSISFNLTTQCDVGDDVVVVGQTGAPFIPAPGQNVLPDNTIWYEFTVAIGANQHDGILPGTLVKSNYYNAARTQGSGASFMYNGTTTPGKAGLAPDIADTGLFYDLDGKEFEYIGDVVYSAAFGAIADNITDAILHNQSAVSFAMETASVTRSEVVLPGGQIFHSDTLQIGWGVNLRSLTLSGAGGTYKYAFGSSFAGSTIRMDLTDRPCIVVQGARGTVIRYVGAEGTLQAWITDNQLTQTVSLIDDTDPANWVDPAAHANSDSRYAPHAGIAIDPYSGPIPTPAYPTPAYPAFLGAVTPYDKSFSSDVLIDRCYIRGFNVGVVNQPCDADANGDFTKIESSEIVQCKYDISVGNTQSRNVNVQNLSCARCFTFITTSKHGRQNGRLGGPVLNCTVGGMINLLEFDNSSSIVGPVTFDNFYCEQGYKIGVSALGTSNELGYTFRNSHFAFQLQTDARGVPANILGNLGQITYIEFEAVNMVQFPRVIQMNLKSDLVHLNGLNLFPLDANLNYSEIYERQASSAMCNLAFDTIDSPLVGKTVKYTKQDNASASSEAATISQGKVLLTGGIDSFIPIFAHNTSTPLEPYVKRDEISYGKIETISKSSLASLTQVDKTLTMTFTSRTEAKFQMEGPLPGDVLLDQLTGTVYWVRSRIGLVVLAEAQNNYVSDGGGGFNQIEIMSFDTGNMYVGPGRRYTPRNPTQGDITLGSPIITNVGRADGAFGDILDFPVGSRLCIERFSNRPFSENESDIVASDAGARTITLSGNAQYTAERIQLLEFMAVPIANV